MIIFAAAHSCVFKPFNKFGDACVPRESVVRGTNRFGAMAFKFRSPSTRPTVKRPTLMPVLANAALIRRLP